ncbi:ATP-binding protein [Spirochaeta isovalerica]|uniref:histidine kinase n=1 Tax=Spirochaeta isovalerica TaxID=150 RepID=A0A841R7J4_9SPIO|nr:ATP-binding protein [Spirochaeta isovalerica]MBB6479010.1 signal transduction histidine kinase [Spirochaeta isovalerica]
MEKRILIVEDEGIVALDIQSRLESHGYGVIDIVSTGSRAIEIAKEEVPDLILMDINLKGSIDGIETASLIRRAVDCPIIFLTAFADEKTMKKARISDASGYILKPFREGELLVTIELAIKRDDVRKKIQDNSNWLYSTLNNMNDAVITVSEENRVIFFNRKAGELMDYDLSPGDIFEIDDYIFSEKGRMRFRKGEREIEIEYSRTEIFEDDQKLGQVHFIHDITKQVAYEIGLEKARRAAEDASRAKNDFLANITHELRTPLNTIIGMNSIVSELSTDSELKEMHELIGKAADRLLKQVNELLELAEIDRGVIKILTSRFSVKALIEEVAETFRQQAELKSIDLLVSTGDLPVIVADKNKIREIISCLLSNAFKFTQNGHIEISARVDKGALILCFKDTGIGLSDDQKKRIFQLFTQVDGSRTRYYGGVGVGLTLVNKLVQLLNGSLEVESELSEGSTFTIQIPVEISSDQKTVEIVQETEAGVSREASGMEKELISLVEELKIFFEKKEYDKCNRRIREFRSQHKIVELNFESEALFRLAAAVKLKNIDKLNKIHMELTSHIVSSSGGVYENSYS